MDKLTIDEIKVALFDIFVEQGELKRRYDELEKAKNQLGNQLAAIMHPEKPVEGPTPEPSNK